MGRPAWHDRLLTTSWPRLFLGALYWMSILAPLGKFPRLLFLWTHVRRPTVHCLCFDCYKWDRKTCTSWNASESNWCDDLSWGRNPTPRLWRWGRGKMPLSPSGAATLQMTDWHISSKICTFLKPQMQVITTNCRPDSSLVRLFINFCVNIETSIMILI